MRRAALLLVVLCACHPTIDFDLTKSGTVDIPGGGPAGVPLALTIPLPELQNVDTSSLPGFPSTRTAKDHIQSARAKKITLTVTSPAGRDLSFLSNVALSISAPGQQAKQFAHLSPFPTSSSADLQLDDVELAPYLKADSFSITTDVAGTSPGRSVSIRADLDLGVTASIL